MIRQRRPRRRTGRCIFPGYRWCGPKCSGPGMPINDVDGCCMAHDRCLQVRTRCECDRMFRECLENKVNFSTRKGRVAGLMYRYITIQSAISCFNR